MNYVDIAILVLLGVGAITGLIKGFVSELISIVGFLLAFIIANEVAPLSLPLLDWLSIPSENAISRVVVWLVILLLVLLLLRLVSTLLTKLLQALNIGWINRLLGMILGIVKYTLIACLVVTILEVACSHFDEWPLKKWLADSQGVEWIHEIVSFVSPYTEEYVLKPASQLLNR